MKIILLFTLITVSVCNDNSGPYHPTSGGKFTCKEKYRNINSKDESCLPTGLKVKLLF
ncbi:hypothetical protein GDO81_028711 [Engystomops pustulosus]|uniref:Uncharacterized protein n=1 Tax=Engystomops pustulosus TaxID=76066 RepID=A0AAV6YCU8_ENGPU|nr:hypothetical protein GDO81_028711 [Engystomops pustulosus]